MLSSSATGLLQPKGGSLVYTVPSLTMMIGKLRTLLSSKSKKSVTYVECHANEADLKLVGQWLEKGNFKIPIDSIYKIRKRQSAMMKQVMVGENGRVVVQIENGW
eukprot:scaffold56_cov195-Chaetoceros_neogracile.AAC.2